MEEPRTAVSIKESQEYLKSTTYEEWTGNLTAEGERERGPDQTGACIVSGRPQRNSTFGAFQRCLILPEIRAGGVQLCEDGNSYHVSYREERTRRDGPVGLGFYEPIHGGFLWLNRGSRSSRSQLPA